MIPEGPIIAEPRTIQVDALKLDPENVRFKHLPKKPTDSQIEELLWEESDTHLLYEEIRASGGLSEKPLVDADLIVKEGNRRLVCLRRLRERAHKGQLAPYNPDHFDFIQVLVLSPDTPPKAVDIYLARVHVKGKKPWATFNKAQHIYNLNKTHHMSYSEIAQFIAMSKTTVQTLIKAYEATQEYRDKYASEDPEWFRKFTYFDELHKRKDLSEWRANSVNCTKFAEWVRLNKFKNDVRLVRKLSQILDMPEALAMMEKDGHNAPDALDVVSQRDPTITSDIFKTVKQTTLTLRTIPRAEFIASIKDSARLKLLQDLSEEVQGVLRDIETLRVSVVGSKAKKQ